MSNVSYNGFDRFQSYWWVGEIKGTSYDLYKYPSKEGRGKTHVQVHREGFPAQLFKNCSLKRAVDLLRGDRR